MDSASFQFVLFGLTAAIFSNFASSRLWRSIVLFVFTVIFLGFIEHDPFAFLPLIAFLFLGYSSLLLLKRGWVASARWSIPAVVLVYIWLKRYKFLPEGMLLQFPYFLLGLSYILFRVLHLLIEARDGDSDRIGFGAYLLYMLNFTTFVSGPIQPYHDFARDQFAHKPIPLDAQCIGLQLERLVRGFFKINVLATLLDVLHADAFVELSQPLTLEAKMFAVFRLVFLYPFFLYANFSGYIDIVIALARLMRVRLPENFDRPFSAPSFLEFWNRWHITLSNWLKKYVYYPMLMALMRRNQSRKMEPFIAVFCFFVTFFLVGVWHGRTSEFLVFGVLVGAGVSINKLWQVLMAGWLSRGRYKSLSQNPAYISLARGLTFSWFAFSSLWFWASWQQLDQIAISIGALPCIAVALALWMFTTVLLAAWEALRASLLAIRTEEGPVFTSRYARVVYASALGFAAFVMIALLNQPAPGIVYKAF
jgi:alginate O-acetyltransferase complex protein AlgI